MIKQLLVCRHLLSTKPGGVEIQMYLAIIACLLILIYTGGQPTKRTYEMICFYLLGSHPGVLSGLRASSCFFVAFFFRGSGRVKTFSHEAHA